MSAGNNTGKPLSLRVVDSGSTVVLELTNRGDQTLKSMEILSIFLKDTETPGGGPSRVHIRFATIPSIQPKAMTVLSPRTWIEGKPVDADHDQLTRLKEFEGQVKPYVLDISWQDPDDKMRFQRIPLGH
jgi:hypothetical protein